MLTDEIIGSDLDVFTKREPVLLRDWIRCDGLGEERVVVKGCALDFQHLMDIIGGSFFFLSIVLRHFYTCSTDTLLLSILHDNKKANYDESSWRSRYFYSRWNAFSSCEGLRLRLFQFLLSFTRVSSSRDVFGILFSLL